MDNLSTIIIDPTENVISILGNGYFQSFLSSGFVGRGFAILSDKRIYFRGNCLKKTNFGYITVKKESVVDIEDVTGTGYEIINPVSMLVTGGMNLLLSILSFVLSTISYSTRSVGIVFGAIFLFFAFFFVWNCQEKCSRKTPKISGR